MNYILGIDQRETKTAAAIISENRTISGVGYAKGAYFPKQTAELILLRKKMEHNLEKSAEKLLLLRR